MQHGKYRLLLPLLAVSAIAMSAYALNLEPPAQPPAEAASVAATPRANPSASAAPTITLESADYSATISARNTAILHFVLKDPRYERDGKPIDLITTDKPQYLPLRTEIAGVQVPADAQWEIERLGPGAARFSLRVGGLMLVRKLEVGSGPYQLWSTLRVVNTGKAQRAIDVSIEGHHYARRADEQGGFLAGRSALTSNGLCLVDDSPERFEREDIVEDKPKFDGKVQLGALGTVYFTQGLAAHDAQFARCQLSGSDRGGTAEDPDGSLLSVVLTYPSTKLAPGGEATFRTLAYLGPKLPGTLAQAGHELKRTSFNGGMPGIDAIANGLVAMLSFIHEHVISNWGVAIILLTIFVKLVLYPLTAKSFQSIAAMRMLKPEIDALNEKYKNDREKKGAAMMELYRKHKINPFGGCLPQLFQLPIWWALYMSLSTNVELFKRPFFGFWQDLTAPDPFYVLPVALGVLMWVQQKITPSTMDPAQAKMMLYVMPAMITSFMLFLPAGLCLYMFTNSVLSIGQQRFIEYRIAHKQAATGAGAGGPSGSPSDASANAASPRRTGRGRA